MRRGSCSPDNLEFGHFTLYFYTGQQRNVTRIITHVYSRCFPRAINLLFNYIPVSVPLPSTINHRDREFSSY